MKNCKECGCFIGNNNHVCNIPWLTGKKVDRRKYPHMGHFEKHSEESLLKMSKSHMGNKARLGKYHTAKTKVKISQSVRDNPVRYWLGKKRSKKDRDNISLSHIGLLAGDKHPNWKGGKPKCIDCGKQLVNYHAKRCVMCRVKNNEIKTPTSIEKIVYSELKTRGFIFETQKIINGKFIVDAYIPSLNLIIEIDGKYWHNLEHVKRKDSSENAYLNKCGFKLLRLSEAEVNNGSFRERMGELN